jgi:hypothetical protein
LQIESLPETELAVNFRHLTDHSKGEDDDVLKVEEPALKKCKAPSVPAKSKAQGGLSTTALEKKKKKTISSSPVEDEDDSLPTDVPVAKSILVYE